MSNFCSLFGVTEKYLSSFNSICWLQDADCLISFQAVQSGLLKILSKMGISLLSRYVIQFLIVLLAMFFTPSVLYIILSVYNYDFPSMISLLLFKLTETSSFHFLVLSYCGAQIFEIYGLGREVVDLAFCGSVSSIGGLTLDEVRNITKWSNWP